MRKLIIITTIVLTVSAIAYRISGGKKPAQTPPGRGPASEKVEDVIAYLANEAVVSAREDFGKELDYSIQSIRTVDEILEQLHQQVQRNPRVEGIHGLASIYGAYIGESIRRSESGVRWEQDHPVAGAKSYPLHWKGGQSFPMAWCLKRMKFGQEDMLWFKYAALKQQSGEDAGAGGEPETKAKP